LFFADWPLAPVGADSSAMGARLTLALLLRDRR
jgi:hypothetical protein